MRTTIEFKKNETTAMLSMIEAIADEMGEKAQAKVAEYSMKLLSEKYDEAFSRGIGIAGSNYTNTMMVQLGVRLHFAAGSDKNIKLTTRDDLDLFKGYLAKKDADWMK